MEVNKDFKDYLARTNSAAYARLVNGTGMTDIGGLMGQMVASAGYNMRHLLYPNKDFDQSEIK